VTAGSLPGLDAQRHCPTQRRSILVELREQTHAEHAAIESSLDLMSETLSLPRYRRTLERFYGYYSPLEQKLRGVAGLADGGPLTEREKSSWLLRDLCVLGAHEGLPLCRELPALDNVPAALGCLYVLEGASLGGRIISRQLRTRLSITPESGGRFFHGYGDQTGQMWQTLQLRLTALIRTPQAVGQATRAAQCTFRTLRLWCEREPGV
jgi:heme oxygenase